jgi:hypothetical protein
MPDPARHPRPATAALLWALSFLFLLRVLGQAAVVFAGATWLPPMSEWQSGLLPYPALLASQAAILAVMAWINTGVTRVAGFFARRHPRLGRFLLGFAIVYAAAMSVRYVVSGYLHPDRRLWPPGIIPIVFHFVLAGYVYALSRLVRRATDPP